MCYRALTGLGVQRVELLFKRQTLSSKDQTPSFKVTPAKPSVLNWLLVRRFLFQLPYWGSIVNNMVS